MARLRNEKKFGGLYQIMLNMEQKNIDMFTGIFRHRNVAAAYSSALCRLRDIFNN